jgi:hypothetical protein
MRKALFLLALSCSFWQCEKKPDCADGTCLPDLYVDLPDLRMPVDVDLATPPDLKAPPDLAPACGGPVYKYATNALRLPTNANAYSIDIDGDGRADNQLKNLLSAISAAGFDLQTAMDQSVADGQVVLLGALAAEDLTNIACARLDLNEAQPRAGAEPRPKYDGTDTFKVAAGKMPAQLRGEIKTAQLDTTQPPRLAADDVPRLEIGLPLFIGTFVRLPLYGVHVQGKVDQRGVTTGQIHGVIRKEDIDKRVIPSIAEALTQIIRSDPMSATTRTLIQLFEDTADNPVSKTKCDTMPMACCAKSPTTCTILPEEVAGNALIASLLAPDVQVFDGMKWKPVPRGTQKDAMSVGLGFTAVKASF